MRVIRKWPVVLLIFASALCVAQLEPPAAPVAPQAPAWTDWSGPRGSSRIRARIRQDPPPSSHSIAVEVEVENIFLTDSDAMSPTGMDRGLVRYRVDRCAPVATVATNLRFDQLSSGDHTVTITVIAPTSRPVTPEVTVQVKIP